MSVYFFHWRDLCCKISLNHSRLCFTYGVCKQWGRIIIRFVWNSSLVFDRWSSMSATFCRWRHWIWFLLINSIWVDPSATTCLCSQSTHQFSSFWPFGLLCFKVQLFFASYSLLESYQILSSDIIIISKYKFTICCTTSILSFK